MRHSDARLAEQVYAAFSYPGASRFMAFDGSGPWAYQALYTNQLTEPTVISDIPIGGVAYDAFHGFLSRGGTYLAYKTHECRWQIDDVEDLFPAMASGLGVFLSSDWLWAVPAATLAPVDSITWHGQRGWFGTPLVSDFIDMSIGQSELSGPYRSWRTVLQNAECQFIPAQLARGRSVTNQLGIYTGVIDALTAAQHLMENPASRTRQVFVNPNAIEMAVEFLMRPGLSFGVEGDPRSPFFNQFVIFTAGEFATETIEDVTTRWLIASPWRLTSSSEFVAEFGHVNVFERIDSNDTLPQRIEIELIWI